MDVDQTRRRGRATKVWACDLRGRIDLDAMQTENNTGRIEKLTDMLGSVFVPVGFAGLIGTDANPHSGLWSVLSIIGVAIGAPSAVLSLIARWRRRRS